MLKKDENFHSTCEGCGKLIPNQHFDCQRRIKLKARTEVLEELRIIMQSQKDREISVRMQLKLGQLFKKQLDETQNR